MKQDLFVCPRCRSTLERITSDRLTCPKDGLEYWKVDGIWRFLLPESEAHYSHFIKDYESIRRAEERGSSSALYYRALPFKDLSGKFTSAWNIRARSYKVLVNNLLTRLQSRLERALRILDLGAGNGWLSNRLAAQGDRVIAVDLSVDNQDGLGAWKHYDHSFTPVQAEFNHLPVMDRYADAVIFNASLHYSENYAETLKEASRVLAVQGVIVIMDSPVYRRSTSGEQMVKEREAQFQEKYGFASDNLESENYLTYARLDELARELNLSWKFMTPFYGFGWMLRPLFAGLLRRREPAKFHLIVGRRNTARD
ncbi:MAG TPA: methyltransferase domain-containing protein [Anaerolineales bacterium]|nr:methyltransferase domain-containing protein [Anaerolineales bacterium]